jgi:hypothetical protein
LGSNRSVKEAWAPDWSPHARYLQVRLSRGIAVHSGGV